MCPNAYTYGNIDIRLEFFYHSGLIQQRTNRYFFFIFFSENRICYIMQIVSIRDNLHKMSRPIFGGGGKKKEKNISKCCLLDFLPSMLRVKLLCFLFTAGTVNPHYTNTRYNDKICYTDNLTSTETLSQKVTVNQELCSSIIIQYFKQHVLDSC